MSATSLTQTPLQSTANKPTIDTAILWSVWHTELKQHYLTSLIRADEAEEWGQDLEERMLKQREQENGEGGRVTGGLYLDKYTHNEKKINEGASVGILVNAPNSMHKHTWPEAKTLIFQ